MNNWQIVPEPQHVTELYFTHYQRLPATLVSNASENVDFTVHNLEHHTTTYRYKLVATPANAGPDQLLGSGVFTLAPEKSLATSRTVTVPPLGARIAIKVNLQYEQLAPGSGQSSLRMQSIHYWTSITSSVINNKENHEASS